MKKKLRFSFLIFCSLAGFSQNYQVIDQKVRTYPAFESLSDLGIRIQNDFAADSLRVRAAFIWVTDNMAYGRNTAGSDGLNMHVRYSSERDREEAIYDLVELRIAQAFRKKMGVCIDYSLFLNALFEQFGLPSKIITGVVKTEIEDIQGEEKLRNHSWNAVQLNGRWRLMDATWAAGFSDPETGRFVKKYLDHYYFTDPSDFIRHHFPVKEEWQLLEQPVDATSFFSAPIFLPDYCEEDIHLSSQTSGILTLAEGEENYLYFDRLPDIHLMHYTINGDGEFRRMAFKKGEGAGYISKIKLRKRFNREYDYLTIYMNNTPILNFRIREALAQ